MNLAIPAMPALLPASDEAASRTTASAPATTRGADLKLRLCLMVVGKFSGIAASQPVRRARLLA